MQSCCTSLVYDQGDRNEDDAIPHISLAEAESTSMSGHHMNTMDTTVQQKIPSYLLLRRRRKKNGQIREEKLRQRKSREKETFVSECKFHINKSVDEKPTA